MTQEDMLEKLFEEVRFRIGSQNATYSMIKQYFIESINDMQYVVVPKSVESLNNKSADFERVVEQNIFGEDSSQNFTINGQMIITQLASEGWLVIPPL